MMKTHTLADQSLNPSQVLDLLKEGNKRFTSGVRSVDSMLGHLRMAELAERGQKPMAVVLTCSDSRSPAELIFDQGIGDLFVVRVAGNVVAPSLIASIEFAVANFGSPLIVVLGHTLCGAVQATIKNAENPSNPLPSANLEELVGLIRPAVDKAKENCSIGQSNFLHHATIENVKRSQRLICERSRIIGTLVDTGKVAVIGAILDFSTGKVNFINESKDQPSIASNVTTSSKPQQSLSARS